MVASRWQVGIGRGADVPDRSSALLTVEPVAAWGTARIVNTKHLVHLTTGIASEAPAGGV